MQTFSNMRRSGSYKQTLLGVALFIGLYAYESLASMTIWLPPLIGVCLGLFMKFDKEDRFYSFMALLFGVALIESENNLPMGMLLGLFVFLALLVVPSIQTFLNTPKFAKASYVALAYLGLYIVAMILDIATGSSITPPFFIMLYYVAIEIVIVMFL
ncbi:hypothetical protein [Helicobacter labetoulli]|uniref:hypothetical protein n=2 Tax=Helicobacter labetoulli TaxID=2315333 RepID=UPI001FC912C6|nr:hypothetical protein [Helicobacter labetoulli]